MFQKTMRAGLAAVLAAGAAAAVAGPAEAAPKKPGKCHLGLWKTTGLKANITGRAAVGGAKVQDVDYAGMSGIRLKVSPQRLVYDFTGSKKEKIKGLGPDGRRMEAWEQLTGVLHLPSKITADAKGMKGRITTRNKRASGPATGTGMTLKPQKASWGRWKVAAHAKVGHFDTPVVKNAKFACNPKKKTLRLVDVRKWEAEVDQRLVRFTETVDIRFKLVRR